MRKIQLGDKVKDRVTGFAGIAVGITKYLTGCDQVVVCPPCDKQGGAQEPFSFDITRLEIVKKQAVTLDEEKKEKKGADFSVTRTRKI